MNSFGASQTRFKFVEPHRLIVQQDESPAKSPLNNFEKIRNQHNEIYSYIDQVEDKTVIACLHNEDKIKQLNYALINQHERLKQQVIKLEEKLQQQQSIETHPQIREDFLNLAKVEQYKNSLLLKSSKLGSALEENNKNILTLQQEVFNKRLTIRELVQRSWEMQERMKRILQIKQKKHAMSIDIGPRSAKNQASNFTESLFITGPQTSSIRLPKLKNKHQSLSNQVLIMELINTENVPKEKVRELIEVQKKIKETQAAIKYSKDLIARKCTKFNAVKNLLTESIQIGIKSFQNKQKIAGKNGYADSMMFEMSTMNNSILNKSILNESQHFKNERNIKSILFETLQQIMIDMLSKKNQEIPQQSQESILTNQYMQWQQQQSINSTDVKIGLDQFLSFNPSQVPQ